MPQHFVFFHEFFVCFILKNAERSLDLEEGLRQLQGAVQLLEAEPVTSTPLFLYTIVNTDFK